MRPLLHRFMIALAIGVPVAALSPGQAAGQAPAASDTLYRIDLVDGSTVFGRIVESTDERIVVVNDGGARFEIDLAQIRTIEVLDGRIVDGQIWPVDASRTRLFFGPTGRSAGPGAGYVGLFELFFSFAAVGIGDRVTLAAGTPILPGAMGEVFYIAPKLTFVNAPTFQLAAGGLAFFLTDEVDEGSAGVTYGVATFGGSDDAVSVGAGWAFALTRDESAISDEPVLMLGLERRTSRSIKLISENYFVDGILLLSGGIRLLGERFSADIGVGASPAGDDPFCCLPILTAAYRF